MIKVTNHRCIMLSAMVLAGAVVMPSYISATYTGITRNPHIVTDKVYITPQDISDNTGAASPDTIDVDVEELQEVVIKGVQAPIKVTADVPIQTLTGVRMQELGIQNIADAVKRFAGTTVRDYGGVGGLKTVSVRNMGAAHTAVSYDGVPVSNCQGGQIDISKFSLDNVATLSLAVGASEDIMQPARLYASGAVLSITSIGTRNLNQEKKFSGEVQIKTGDWGYVNPMMRWSHRLSRIFAYTISGDYLHSDGNYPFTLVNGNEVTKEKRINSRVDSWHAEGNVYAYINPRNTLQLKGYYYWSKRGLPGAVTLYNPVSTEVLTEQDIFGQVKYKGDITDNWKIQAIAKYTYGRSKDREQNNMYESGIYQDIHNQHEYYISATGMYTDNRGLQIALAQDGIINRLRSTLAACPFPTRYTSLTALSARWNHKAITANATLTMTNTKETVEAGEAPEGHSRLNPTVALSIRPVGAAQFYIRGMYKNTFRMPTFNDLYYDRMGNRNLKPESANEYNLGVTWSAPAWGVMRYFAVTADAYYNDVRNKIVAFPTTYNWRMVNFGKVHISGIDFTLSTSISLPLDMEVAVTGAYTYQKAINAGDENTKNHGEQLPYTPQHTGNMAITLNTPWINIGYSFFGVGKRYYMSQNIPANEIKGYTEQTLSAGRSIRIQNVKLDIRGEIVNLGNVQYEVIRFYPMPGRSWRITLGMQY